MTATKGLGITGNGVGVTTPLDHKLAQSGLIAKTGAGTNLIRPGLFYDGVSNIVSGAANMSYNVAPFTAALTRGASSGTVLLANDGTVNVVTTAAPASNSRIDIVYVWQREFSLDGTNSNPVIGVAQGAAAASPVAPSLAAFPGALELARITVPAGVTATNTGTTITQTAPFTATAGGVLVFRNATERDAAVVAQGQLGWVIASGRFEQYTGSAWDPATPQFSYYQGSVTPASGAFGDIPTSQTASRGAALVLGSNAVTASVAGWYRLAGNVTWGNNNTGARIVEFTGNGASLALPLSVRQAANSSTAQSLSGVRYLAAGTVVRMRVLQDSGGALIATGAVGVEFLSLGSAPA